MAYLEVQINIKEDYDRIKLFSDYFSDRTKVCSLSADGVSRLNSYHPGLIQKYVLEEKEGLLEKVAPKPKAVLDNKNRVFIENGNIELLSFLEARSLSVPEIKIANLWKLLALVKDGIVDGSEEFMALFTGISEEDPVSKLFSSTGRMKFRNKLFSLQDLGPDFKIKDLNFDKAKSITKNYLNTGDLIVNQYYPESKTLMLQKIGDHRSYVAKFFYVTPNMISMFQKGRILSLASEQAYGSESDKYSLVDPMILPRGFKMKRRTLLTSPRSIPSLLYNAAYAEYIYRKQEVPDQ